MANVSLDVVFGMFFLILSSTDIDFLDRKLSWRTYITKKVLLTIKRFELVKKKEFIAVAFDPKHKTFIIHVICFSSIQLDANVHSFRRLQITGLIAKDAFIKVSTKYSNFADIFSLDLAFKFHKYTGINDHAIKLVNS